MLIFGLHSNLAMATQNLAMATQNCKQEQTKTSQPSAATRCCYLLEFHNFNVQATAWRIYKVSLVFIQ